MSSKRSSFEVVVLVTVFVVLQAWGGPPNSQTDGAQLYSEVAELASSRDDATAIPADDTVAEGLPPVSASPAPKSIPDEIVAQVAKSVVSIHADVGGEVRHGSGFVVRDDGIIATNLSLIQNAQSVRVRFRGGEEVDAVGWLAYSVVNNVALLQCPLPKEAVPPLSISATIPPNGARVFAISRPLRQEPAIAEGIVTGIIDAGSGNRRPPVAVRILTNIAVSPASSGGPLVDQHGAVVGVTQESDKYDQHPNVAIFVESLREPLSRRFAAPTPWSLPGISIPEGPLDSAAAYVNRAEERMHIGDVDRAITDYTEAIRLDPQVAEYYHQRGVAWMSKEDYDRAIADCNEAIRLAPESSPNWFLRGTLWINKCEFDRAIADFSEVIRTHPTSAPPYQLRGYAWLSKGEFDRAIADLDETIRLDPEYDLAYLHRGMAWSQKGDKQRAKTDFEMYKRRSGQHPGASEKHTDVIIKSDEIAGQSSAGEEVEVNTPSADAMGGSQWIVKGRWIAGEAEQQVVLHFHGNRDLDAQECQLTFDGAGVGSLMCTYDIQFDRDAKRILFFEPNVRMKENRPPAVATATLRTDGSLRVQGKFEFYQRTLKIDAEFSRIPDATSN
jgi:tetratricopeptide (TPR) repeat protein